MTFYDPEINAFENIVGKGENTGIVGKGENAGNQHLLLLLHFYAPASKDWGHIVLPLSVCLSAQT